MYMMLFTSWQNDKKWSEDKNEARKARIKRGKKIKAARRVRTGIEITVIQFSIDKNRIEFPSNRSCRSCECRIKFS